MTTNAAERRRPIGAEPCLRSARLEIGVRRSGLQ